MDQLTQQLKSGKMAVHEVPVPGLSRGMVLVRNHYSVISAGTEGSTVKTARKSLIGKARERPQQVKQVLDVLKRQGPVQTYRAVMKKLDAYSPLGFDADRWRTVPRQGSSNRQDGTISLVSVGLLQRQIDVMPLLEALVDRPHVHLTLIGDDGDGERYPEVVRFIDENRMRNVSMTGRVEPERMGEHLQTMDVGVMSMISSSIPNKVFDYIACYLPILVLGENDSSRLIRDHDIGWSVSYDEHGIGEFLNSVSSEDIVEKRKNVSRMRSSVSRDTLHQKILELIES